MLLNLSNHPKAKWDERQLAAAVSEFGSVEDIPFPQIHPSASLDEVRRIAMEYAERCSVALKSQETDKHNAVHLMGEFTFTYLFVKEMEKRGILCVASTTERLVTDNPDGSKTTVFKFVQFRPYFEAG
jgi:hypothetical protein